MARGPRPLEPGDHRVTLNAPFYLGIPEGCRILTCSSLVGIQPELSWQFGGDGKGDHTLRAGSALSYTYLGYEYGRALSPSKGPWNAVWFAGLNAGVNDFILKPFAAPRLGIVAGQTKGSVRPELALLVTGQAGFDEDGGSDHYLVSVSAEPRLRIVDDNHSFYFGLIVFGGHAWRCDLCFRDVVGDPASVRYWGIAPSVSMAYLFE